MTSPHAMISSSNGGTVPQRFEKYCSSIPPLVLFVKAFRLRCSRLWTEAAEFYFYLGSSQKRLPGARSVHGGNPQVKAQDAGPTEENNRQLAEVLAQFKDLYADYGNQRKFEARQ